MPFTPVRAPRTGSAQTPSGATCSKWAGSSALARRCSGLLLVVVTSTVLGILLGLPRRMARRMARRRAGPHLRRRVRLPVAAHRDHGRRAVRQGTRRPGHRDEHRLRAVRRSSPARPSPPSAACPTWPRTAFRASAAWIAFRRVLPNVTPIVGAQSTLNFGYVLAELAALSFLGLGVQAPTADWGAMINEAQAGSSSAATSCPPSCRPSPWWSWSSR